MQGYAERIHAGGLMNFTQEYQNISLLSVIPELHPRTNRPINKPLWLKSGLTGGETLFNIKKDLREKKLHVVIFKVFKCLFQ